MLKKDSFSKGYGLITDYIAAVLHELRNYDWTDKLKEYALFDGSLSERDHLAIRKTFSGMMKLLYPDGAITDEEAYELVDFAAESRKRVKDQLYVIDETFKAEPAKFTYEKRKGEGNVVVETLERVSNPDIFPKTDDFAKVDDNEEQNEQASATSDHAEERKPGKRSRIMPLRQGTASFRLGQSGVTYKDIFGPYLKDAGEITVEDPFIRTSWQVRNFLEFAMALIEIRPVEGLKLNLVTNEEEDKIPELIDKLDDIKDDLASFGIDFNYKFRDFHDRFITTDNGWKIQLGRGLDIYEKYSPYSVASSRQDRRKCKEFSLTYVKEK